MSERIRCADCRKTITAEELEESQGEYTTEDTLCVECAVERYKAARADDL
jgi:hypothetical protein